MAKPAFYAAGVLSVDSGFKRVKGPGADMGFEKQRGVAQDENGVVTGSVLHSIVFNFDENFESQSATMTLATDLGVLDNHATLLGIKIDTALGEPVKVTKSAVQYTASSDVAPLKKCTHGIDLAKQFGAVLFSGATTGDAVLQSSNATIVVDVVPCFDGEAEGAPYKGHEITNPRMEISESWKGKPTSNAGAGWDVTSAKPDRDCKDFYKWDVSAVKPLTLTTVV